LDCWMHQQPVYDMGMGMVGMVPGMHFSNPALMAQAMATMHPPPPFDADRKRSRNAHPPPVGVGVPRNNEIGEPSRVIHMRNVTPDVSQLSIQNLALSFGRIRNIVMLRQKNQALIEMESLQSAQQMVEYFKEAGFAEIDGRRVYLRYSRHKELTSSVHTSKTLLVSMFNTQYDVSAHANITPTIVYQIFGSYGPVEKIVVLPKNESSAQNHNRIQALVQFESKEAAEQVKNMLQGQPVTLGDTITFSLDIQFSRMDEIKTSSPHNSLSVPKPAQPPPSSMSQNPIPPPSNQQYSAFPLHLLVPQPNSSSLPPSASAPATSPPSATWQ